VPDLASHIALIKHAAIAYELLEQVTLQGFAAESEQKCQQQISMPWMLQ